MERDSVVGNIFKRRKGYCSKEYQEISKMIKDANQFITQYENSERSRKNEVNYSGKITDYYNNYEKFAKSHELEYGDKKESSSSQKQEPSTTTPNGSSGSNRSSVSSLSSGSNRSSVSSLSSGSSLSSVSSLSQGGRTRSKQKTCNTKKRTTRRKTRQ